MKTYTVTFVDNKCGRGNRAFPFEVKVREVSEVPEAVLRKARTYLASKGVDYAAQYAEDGSGASGEIYAGFNTVGVWNAVLNPPVRARRDTVKRRPRVGDHVRLIGSPERVFRVEAKWVRAGRLELRVRTARTEQPYQFWADQVETLSAAFMADWSL